MRSTAILNPFFSTLGGGERSTIEYARALRDLLSEPVVIYTLRSPAASIRRLEAAFGRELDGISVRTAATMDELPQLIRQERHATFVNHCHYSTMANPARRGFYVMMFPREADSSFLDSYDRILCISAYTAQYTARYHPQISHKLDVVYSPIAPREATGAQKDWRLCINVGRFSSQGHSKCQYELGAIMAAVNRRLANPLRLSCCGRINEPEYFERCSSLSDANIRFEGDLSERALSERVERAGLYLHATGLGVPFGERPELCEHLGLAVVEAMATGAIPIVVGRGGAVEFVEHGLSGFVYENAADLSEILVALAHMRDEDKQAIGQRAKARAAHFGYEHFVHDLEAIVRDEPKTSRRTAVVMGANSEILTPRSIAVADSVDDGCKSCMGGLVTVLQAQKVQSLLQSLESTKASYAAIIGHLSAENASLTSRLHELTHRASMLESQVKVAASEVPEVLEATAARDVTQVFYDLGGGFQEVDSVSVPFRYARAPVRYELTFPSAALSRPFRIDVGAKEGLISIHEVILRDASGRVIWKEQGAGLANVCSVGGTTHHVPSDHDFRVLCYGDDPFIVVRSNVSCSTSNVRLAIVVSYEAKVDLRAVFESMRHAAAV